jgi:hypothetical protein
MDAGASSDGGGGSEDGGGARDGGGGGGDDGGAMSDGGGTMGDDGGTMGDDGGPADGGCTPETDMALCTAAGAECGAVTATDRCGASRTLSCGSCTLPETCGGVAESQCGCDVPTEVRSATCSFTSSGFRLRWGGDTTTYSYAWSSTGTPPASCGGSGSAPLFGAVGTNSMILPGGPGIGQCWFVRLCTWEPMCVSADYSPGVVFQACVNGSGTGGTCTMM